MDVFSNTEDKYEELYLDRNTCREVCLKYYVELFENMSIDVMWFIVEGRALNLSNCFLQEALSLFHFFSFFPEGHK